MKNNNNMYVLYFYCTPYKESSAGVRTIYTMIDFYNKNNQPAFILYQNETIGAGGYSNSNSTSNMSTPVLTNELLDQHVKNNKIPIIIYPDTVSGNPLKAKNVCRIVLYYDGVFTKKSCLKNSKNEGVIYFSKQIKDKAEVKSALYEHIISFPVADEKILNGLNEKLERKEEYYYDGKYSKNFGGTIPNNIKKLKKIDRGYHDSLTQAKIFNKLKTAKVLHVFEDTALIYESLLLGCPVNIHPKGFFYEDKPLGSNEVNLYGSISKTHISEDDIRKSNQEITKFKGEYENWLNNGKSSLLEYKKFLKKHDQPFDESSIIKIKQNIALSKKFFNEVLNEKNNYENKNFFGKIVEIIIYRLFKIYKLTQKTYFGKKVIKFIALRIYHSLPTKIKRKLSIIIKN